MSTAALAKKSVKVRCCNKKNDLTKLREDLRKRCKVRMKEQREELLNQRRFGVTSDGAVQDKLKEIFHTELNDLTKTDEYDVPQGTVDVVKKLIDNVDQADPKTEEEKLIVDEFRKLEEEEKQNLLEQASYLII